MYDPDLNFLKRWDVNELVCLEHESKDGLVASVNGVRHGILVPVPVNLMEKAGTYYFVLHFKDNHADKYKDHQVKPALEINSTGKFKKLAIVIDPGHGKFYNAKGKPDAHGNLPVGFRGGYHRISSGAFSGRVYHEDWGVLVIGRYTKNFLDKKTTLVRETLLTRDSDFDIDENATNITKGCYPHDYIENGIETCRLGFRAYDERCKRAKAFAARYSKDEVIFVSVHTTPAGSGLTPWPRCFYIYWGGHPLSEDCKNLGKNIIDYLCTVPPTDYVPGPPQPDYPQDRKLQILWFSGFDLSKATAADFEDTYDENGRLLYSAADKAEVFSKWIGADQIYPAVLVECYSHGQDNWANNLMDYSFRKELGEAIAKGTLKYHEIKLKSQR